MTINWTSVSFHTNFHESKEQETFLNNKAYYPVNTETDLIRNKDVEVQYPVFKDVSIQTDNLESIQTPYIPQQKENENFKLETFLRKQEPLIRSMLDSSDDLYITENTCTTDDNEMLLEFNFHLLKENTNMNVNFSHVFIHPIGQSILTIGAEKGIDHSGGTCSHSSYISKYKLGKEKGWINICRTEGCITSYDVHSKMSNISIGGNYNGTSLYS
jgi:hypothetical protein